MLFFFQLQEADIVVLGSPKPEEVPLSWIQPETIVLNCSHDLLSGKCVKIGTGLLIKIGVIVTKHINLIQKSVFLKCLPIIVSMRAHDRKLSVDVPTFWVTDMGATLSAKEKPRGQVQWLPPPPPLPASSIKQSSQLWPKADNLYTCEVS